MSAIIKRIYEILELFSPKPCQSRQLRKKLEVAKLLYNNFTWLKIKIDILITERSY